MSTIFPLEIDGSCIPRTDSAQLLAKTQSRAMRFPKKVKHRGFAAKIYRKSASYNYYRVAYYAAGKRHVLNFTTFSDAKSRRKASFMILPTAPNRSQCPPINHATL